MGPVTTLAERDGSGTFRAGAGENEIPALRTRYGKTFDLGADAAGRRLRRWGGSTAPVHCRADPFDGAEAYAEIDLDVRLTPAEAWDAACETNGYQVRFWQSRVYAGRTLRYVAQFRRAGQWLAMAPVALRWVNDAGAAEMISAPQAVGPPDVDNELNHVTWTDVFGPGLHFRYNLRADSFFKALIVSARSDLPVPTISTSGLRLEIVMALAWAGPVASASGFAAGIDASQPTDEVDGLDAADEEVVEPGEVGFLDGSGRSVWSLGSPRAWDSWDGVQGPHEVPVRWQLTRRGGGIFARLSVPAAQLANSATVYPVFIDTVVNEQVGAAADDAEYRWAGTYGSPSSSAWFDGAGATVGHDDGLGEPKLSVISVFRTIAVAQAATISAATAQFKAKSNRSLTTVNARLHMADEDDVGTINSTATYEALAQTTAYTDWDNIASWTSGTWYTSPDITSTVQEVVDRASWASGNDMCLTCRDNASTVGTDIFRHASMYDTAAGDAPKLSITYASGEDPALFFGANF